MSFYMQPITSININLIAENLLILYPCIINYNFIIQLIVEKIYRKMYNILKDN